MAAAPVSAAAAAPSFLQVCCDARAYSAEERCCDWYVAAIRDRTRISPLLRLLHALPSSCSHMKRVATSRTVIAAARPVPDLDPRGVCLPRDILFAIVAICPTYQWPGGGASCPPSVYSHDETCALLASIDALLCSRIPCIPALHDTVFNHECDTLWPQVRTPFYATPRAMTGVTRAVRIPPLALDEQSCVYFHCMLQAVERACERWERACIIATRSGAVARHDAGAARPAKRPRMGESEALDEMQELDGGSDALGGGVVHAEGTWSRTAVGGSPVDSAVMRALRKVADTQVAARTSSTASVREQYLCTGMDAFVSHEPDAMDAMALLHARVARVIMLQTAYDGACGTRWVLQDVPALNHHFTVYVAAGEGHVTAAGHDRMG